MVGRSIRGCPCSVWKTFLLCAVILVWSVSGSVLVLSKRSRGGEAMSLPKVAANYTPLTPLGFLERSAFVYGSRTSVIYGDVRYTWAQTYERCRRMASALVKRGLSRGDIVSVVAPNVPCIYEAHFGVPMAGMVLNAINIRLDARMTAFFLEHSKTKALIVDEEFFPLIDEALGILSSKLGSIEMPLLVVAEEGQGGIDRQKHGGFAAALARGAIEYESFLSEGDPAFVWAPPADEWDSIALGYTSGTTSSPKGVLLSHRGAYVAALSNLLVWEVPIGAVYLWTLPLFHCNGWCYSWGIAAHAGTNVCLRHVTATGIYNAIRKYGVTHFCGAPVVLNMLINSPVSERAPMSHTIHVMTAGAAPPAIVLSKMEEQGFRVTHTYGLTETFGPSTICAWKPEWDSLPVADRARLNSRQGVRYVGLEGLDVVDLKSMVPVPADGATLGEVVMRGNMVMKGYLNNPKATEESFQGGWYHSGDIAVKHPDGYIEIKDRAKDIIISGGENISSLEVESILYRHPGILEASVVARPDEQWGETPCAFITPNGKVPITEADVIQFCRKELPHYMVPRSVVFGPLPKTATGDPCCK
uniref:AMP-dependent synthetase/ligase domain-containing protein n=1 Tax=Physcomitrium patens TaxID=3218 RepID=A0A7I4EM26_PHYPA